MADNEEDLFRQLVGDVTPIKVEPRVTLATQKPAEPILRERRRAAEQVSAKDSNQLSGEFVQPVDPLAELAFQRPGVQHGVYRKLRTGKYPIDARLDLHGYTVEQARAALYEFIRDCMAHDIRCALVTHGKGLDRQPQPALLKSCVANWLPQLDAVLAFHSAQQQHGGVGATYVLLRKNERKSERKQQDDLE